MSSNPIMPSVGRVVLFRSPNSIDMSSDPFSKGPVPALVTRVWGQDCVNLQVQRDGMEPLAVTSVLYDDSELPANRAWSWMDYQVQQAAAAA